MVRDVKNFKLPFWICTLNIVFVYAAVIPINTFTSDILQKKYAINSIQAGEYFGSVYLIAGLVLPLCGFVVDRCGRLALCMCCATLLNMIANLMWILLPAECAQTDSCHELVFVPIVLMGVSYGFFAGSGWNAVVYLVDKDKVGTALGLCSSFQNLGVAIVPPIMGLIKDYNPDKDFGYYWVTRFSFINATIGLGFGLWLFIHDLKYNEGILNMNVQTRN
jgi:nitrate/nitrite transporter NarK